MYLCTMYMYMGICVCMSAYLGVCVFVYWYVYMGRLKNRVPKIGEKRQKHVKKTLFKT